MRVVVFDATEATLRGLLDNTKSVGLWKAMGLFWLGVAWLIGSWLFTLFGRFDRRVAGTSWTHVFTTVGALKNVTEVQYWGHGSPGYVWLGDFRIGPTVQPEALEMARAFAPGAVWWWRTCATLAGLDGLGFATAWTERIGCRIAGHTHNIGFPWHSGTHSLRPKKMPDWPVTEGLDQNNKPLRSSRRAPNTMLFLKSSIPEEW